MRVCAMLVHPVPKMKMNFCNAEKLKRDQNKEFEQIQHHREDNLTYNDNIRQKNTSQSKQTIPCVRNQILAPNTATPTMSPPPQKSITVSNSDD